MEAQSPRRMFSDVQLLEIADKYRTPFFLYSTDAIRERVRELHGVFDGRFEVAMSLKANPNPNLARKLIADVKWFDIASLGEYFLATIAGIPAGQLIFVGPGKTSEELKTAISNSVGLLVAESTEELCQINEISRSFGRRTDVLLRINPDFHQAYAGIQMGGLPSQFGVDTDELPHALALIKSLDYVCFKGVHFYLGSQVLNATALARNFRDIISLACTVQDLYGQPISVIDFGGGFGIPYFPHETPLNMSALGDEVLELLTRHGQWIDKHGCRLLIESGRFLFGEAGVYVCSILYRKRSHGTQYVVLDGGSNFHSSLSGLGKLIRANFPLYTISSSGLHSVSSQEQPLSCHVVGPLCTPLDTLARNVVLQSSHQGDLVVFEKAGAYGLTFSQEKFLSHTSIAEILSDRGQVELIKRRKCIGDLAHEYDIRVEN